MSFRKQGLFSLSHTPSYPYSFLLSVHHPLTTPSYPFSLLLSVHHPLSIPSAPLFSAYLSSVLIWIIFNEYLKRQNKRKKRKRKNNKTSKKEKTKISMDMWNCEWAKRNFENKRPLGCQWICVMVSFFFFFFVFWCFQSAFALFKTQQHLYTCGSTIACTHARTHVPTHIPTHAGSLFIQSWTCIPVFFAFHIVRWALDQSVPEGWNTNNTQHNNT